MYVKMPRKGDFTQTESRLIAAWVWELGLTVIDTEILLGEQGRAGDLQKPIFSSRGVRCWKKEKNGQGKKTAPAPASAMKK